MKSKPNSSLELGKDVERQMANYRFIHAADLHLDSQFGVLSAEFPELAQILRTSTFEAYDRIIDLCIEEKVDALLPGLFQVLNQRTR